MSVLRYCCFRWLLCFRAFVFEPSRPWLVIWCLYDLFMFLELCCDIFSWVPDLDRTRLRAWLVYDWIGGVTSWYQSRLPVGIPLPTPWPKLSLVDENCFTNLAVRPMGPRHQLGGIRIFYSSSILWDSDLSSIRVKCILLNLTLGSRDRIHPESPLLQRIACYIRRFRRYSLIFFRDFVPITFAIPDHR